MHSIHIEINKDAVKSIIKGHLVSRHGEMLTADISDALSKLITESIDVFFSNTSKNDIQIDFNCKDCVA